MKYAPTMTATTPRYSATDRAEPLARRTDRSRPTMGTTIAPYPYFATMARADATAAPSTHLAASEPDERLAHHIDVARHVNASTSYTAKWANAANSPLTAKASADQFAAR